MVKLFTSIVLTLTLAFAARAEPIRVAAAISLRDALEPIAAEYQKESGRTVELVFGSSGQLANRVAAGAPIDLFISASQMQIDQLREKSMIAADSVRIIARNTLVLVVPADSKLPVDSPASLAHPGVRRIALGIPESVPAGAYAKQTLESLDRFETLRPKLVQAANVRQVLDYVSRGEADAGFVYATDAKIEPGVRVVSMVDSKLHEPIVYVAAIVNHARAESAAFLDHLQTESAKKTFERFGFAAAVADN